MVNRFNKRFPHYDDDLDYTTNAPSYYDDLARKQKLIKLLAKRIWEYEETLNMTLEEIEKRVSQRFEEWDRRIESFPENVEDLLKEWLEDGTLDQIINETIFNDKADLIDLNERTHSTMNLAESRWGIAMDGVTDDSDAFESALNYAMQNNLKVLFPVGTIKITRPIFVLFYEVKNGQAVKTKQSFTIEGLGGVIQGILGSYGSKIIAYNIKDTLSAVNLLGMTNGHVTSIEMKNIEIQLDYDTCQELSFCMKVGDTRGLLMDRVALKGFNNLMVRAGSGEHARNQYAFINPVFNQVEFLTEMYYDWDGNIQEKARFGFAIAHERMFFENNYIPYKGDTPTFNSCYFYGTVVNYYVSAEYNHCMWSIQGGYKPEIDITKDTRFNHEWFTFETVDCSVGIMQTGGNLTLINPYFEDVRKSILVKSLFGANHSIIINNPLFLGTLNQRPVINGIVQQAVYAIKILEGTGIRAFLQINGGEYAKGNVGFSEGFLINQGIPYLEVNNTIGVTDSDIHDTYSTTRRTKTYSKSVTDFDVYFTGNGDSSATYLTERDTNINEITLPYDSVLNRIEIIVNGENTTKKNLRIEHSDGTDFIQFELDPNNSTNSIESIKKNGYHKYVIENLGGQIVGGQGVSASTWRLRHHIRFTKNETLKVYKQDHVYGNEEQYNMVVKLFFTT